MKQDLVYYIIILILILLFLKKLYSMGSIKHNKCKNNFNIDFVISRYNENIDYLNNEYFKSIHPYNHNIIVYNKGPYEIDYLNNSLPLKIKKIPNHGRESNTYLHHIINNYNNLADLTIFLPGSCMNPHKKYRTYKTIIKSIENKDSAIIICNELLDYTFEIDKYEPTDNKNYSLNPTSTLLKCTDRPFGLWYEKNIGSFKNYKGISYSCIVAVHKNDILKFPLSYYQNLIKYLENVENTECGHFFERSWANIFDLDEKNIYRCDLLDYIYYSMCY